MWAASTAALLLPPRWAADAHVLGSVGQAEPRCGHHPRSTDSDLVAGPQTAPQSKLRLQSTSRTPTRAAMPAARAGTSPAANRAASGSKLGTLLRYCCHYPRRVQVHTLPTQGQGPVRTHSGSRGSYCQTHRRYSTAADSSSLRDGGPYALCLALPPLSPSSPARSHALDYLSARPHTQLPSLQQRPRQSPPPSQRPPTRSSPSARCCPWGCSRLCSPSARGSDYRRTTSCASTSGRGCPSASGTGRASRSSSTSSCTSACARTSSSCSR